MPDLPADIVFLVICELKQLIKNDQERAGGLPPLPAPPSLAPYAGINRTWNAAIERETFRSIFVTPQRLGEFKAIVAREHSRLSLVRHLEYHLAHEWDCDSPNGQSADGRRENDESFSRSVEEMARVLECWGERDAPWERLSGVHLYVKTCFTRSKEDHCIDTDTDTGTEDAAFLHCSGESLPRMRSVSSFSYQEGHIWPRSLMQILSVMESLDACKLWVSDRSTVNPAIRRDYRKGRWFAVLDPDEYESTDSEEDYFIQLITPRKRSLANRSLVNDLFFAATTAARNMPKLQNMRLQLIMPGTLSLRIGPDLSEPSNNQKLLEAIWDEKTKMKLSAAVLNNLGVSEEQLEVAAGCLERVSDGRVINKQVTTKAYLRPGWPEVTQKDM
ncbi:hypothetical protein SLS57_004833 [Botryosphaeria dothidea]